MLVLLQLLAPSHALTCGVVNSLCALRKARTSDGACAGRRRRLQCTSRHVRTGPVDALFTESCVYTHADVHIMAAASVRVEVSARSLGRIAAAATRRLSRAEAQRSTDPPTVASAALIAGAQREWPRLCRTVASVGLRALQIGQRESRVDARALTRSLSLAPECAADRGMSRA